MTLQRLLLLSLDNAAIYGSGSSNEPLGIKDTTGVGTQTITTFGTFAEYIGMETDVAAANADVANMFYLINASARGALKSTENKLQTQLQFVFENNEINGYPAIVSNQLANNDVLFGDFSQFVIGMWSGLDLTVDPYANATSGSVRILHYRMLTLLLNSQLRSVSEHNMKVKLLRATMIAGTPNECWHYR